MTLVLLYYCFYITMTGQSFLDPQSTGNEWIQEDQQYFKFHVGAEGVYRISYDVLKDAGVPVDEISGSHFEMFALGNRVAIRPSTQEVLGPEDYIEFYGQSEDGSLDARLYADPAQQQLNPFASLYTQNRSYFLSWSDQVSDHQYTQVDNGLHNGGLPIQEAYYMHEERLVFDEFHNKPSRDGRNFIRYSSMDIGEGFGSRLHKDQSITLPITETSTFGVDPTISLRFATNDWSRQWNISLNNEFLNTIVSGGLSIVDFNKKITLEEITNRNKLSVVIASANNDQEKHSLAYVSLKYPRKYAFGEKSFVKYLQHPSILPRYIEFEQFRGSKPILYNLDEGYYTNPEVEDGIVRTAIPVALKEENWVLVDQNLGVNSIPEISEVVLTSSATAGEYLIISHNSLIQSGAVEDYAAYRRSAIGGEYDVSVVSIEEITNTYGYGVPGHPLAIRNYMNFLRKQNLTPSYVFIIGKGYEYSERADNTEGQVPTFGVPGSDNLLVSRDGERFPEMPIGRLAARNPKHVRDYLEKIKLQEASIEEEQIIATQSWKKNILHLSGGSADNQEILHGFLDNMGEIIANNTFGGDIFTFRKTSADPIQTVETEAIVSKINKGAAILTFFGHSAVGTFDFSLEDPSKYDNKGRNPVILSLGCFSGNVHTKTEGISEEFVLEPENGAIAFIASSGTAYPEPQFITGSEFYNLIGEEMYGMPIGQILQASLEARAGSDQLAEQTLIEQMTLHGDPAFRFSTFLGPDYIVDSENVEVLPALINSNTEAITLKFDVVNIGAMVSESLDIDVIHILPDGTIYDTTTVTIPAPGNRTTVTIDIDNPGSLGVGSNRIIVNIDPKARIEEFPSNTAEENNTLIDTQGKTGIGFIVFDQNAKPSFPRNYGITNDANLTLQATVNNGLSTKGRFFMEIDTTAFFESPFLITEEVISTSSTVNWKAPIIWEDGQVYYWRIAPYVEETTLKAKKWETSSFIFLNDYDQGWNQSHYYQKLDNQYDALFLNDDRQLQFDERTWDVRIKNELRSDFDYWVYVNNTPWASLNPKSLAPALAIFVFDERTVLFQNQGTDFGSLPFSIDLFLYKMDKPQDRQNVKDLLGAVPNRARVFMHTILGDETSDLHVEDWAADTARLGFSLYDVLEGYGATKVRDLLDRGTVPYTFVFDKGGDVVVEDIANTIYETIDLSSKARTIWHRGTVNSIAVGPAKKWSTIVWSESIINYDDTKLNIYGLTSSGEKEFIKKIRSKYDVDISDIDANVYPNLELEYYSEDFYDKTSADLNYWRILYDELPDIAIMNDGTDITVSDTLDAGSPLELQFQLGNLSNSSVEPVMIEYILIDLNGRQQIIQERTDNYLDGHEVTDILQTISTDGLAGNYQLIIKANADGKIKETTDCNNYGYHQFYIRPDLRNPLLSVTFDGKRIVDGERIQTKPTIAITLQDLGSKLLLDDPEDFEITLKYPEFLRWKVDVSSPAAEFIPASDINDNQAQFILTPNLNVDGIYTLEVQAKDKAGNLSGAQKYRITFEIDQTADVVVLSVHPNPATNYIDFDYFLKGEYIPEKFILFIYAPDGKLVHEAPAEDWGGIELGQNSYRWHLNGDRQALSNGLYFYHILNSIDSRKDKKKGSVMVVR